MQTALSLLLHPASNSQVRLVFSVAAVTLTLLILTGV